MAFIASEVLDNGLSYITTNASIIHITSAEATSYANVASVTLGNKNFGAGSTFGSPANRSPGRKVTSVAVTNGSVTATGTATHWAVVSGSVLIATGSLSSSQAVTSGNTFTLGAFDIGIPAAV